MPNTTTAFLQKWLNISDYDLALNSDFEHEALHHNVDLTRKYYALVVKSSIENTSYNYNLSFMLDSYRCIFIFNEYYDLDSFLAQLAPNQLVGIGTPHFDLSRTIKEALEALCFSIADAENPIVHFDSIKRFNPLINSNLAYPELRQFFDRFETLYGDTILLDTFWASVLNNHNFTKTAHSLHVHRRTVEYRLNRLHELTGYNPRNIVDCIALISAYVRWRTKNLSLLLNELQSISDSMLPRDRIY
ncbi:hypothetical protein JOC59_000095 [Weissella beninensis]|uniref:Helix-turn-helix domain-containing protein n=1 Tax=Periweissella beninensis TaxID=504936 RepID=A0ABT0VHL0_9LACO|nr:PucR family transcriptional regulator [Periweissella beninensis]MBM7543399.1 hypothetical protein [Periweissella beninensis]MCM2437306.1 helix-turn-helix domain-containing protein [Periweissella beninensis]